MFTLLQRHRLTSRQLHALLYRLQLCSLFCMPFKAIWSPASFGKAILTLFSSPSNSALSAQLTIVLFTFVLQPDNTNLHDLPLVFDSCYKPGWLEEGTLAKMLTKDKKCIVTNISLFWDARNVGGDDLPSLPLHDFPIVDSSESSLAKKNSSILSHHADLAGTTIPT